MSSTRRLALITGGTSGIGFGAAKRLMPQFDLALAFASDEKKAEQAATELRAMASEKSIEAKVATFKAPLSNRADAASLVALVEKEFGKGPSVLVNSAGRLRDGLFMGSDFSNHEALINEHVLVPMALCHLLLKGMYRDRFGRIINLSSISARFAKRGQTNYAAAKSAIEGFTRTLALEVAHRGITVNAIAPGLINTPMTQEILAKFQGASEGDGDLRKKIPAGRAGTQDEVGSLVAYLASEDAAYITGSVITMDGGRSLGDPLS